MPIYIHPIKVTSQGLKNVKEFNKMLDDAKRVVESNGGKVVSSYSTLGKHDLVVVLEFPDNATAMKVSALIAAQGNFQPLTLASVNPRVFATALARAK